MFNRANYISFDVETSSAVNHEYALQPFRALKGEAFISSYATTEFFDGKPKSIAVEMPSRLELEGFLWRCIGFKQTIIGWNISFDAAWLCAIGLEHLVMQCKWLDAMLLYKHLTVTPEYGLAKVKKKSYGLKAAVAEFIPAYAEYGEGIDFHSMEPEAVAKRLHYNKLDTVFTMKLAEQFYNELEAQGPQRLKCALIEAACIPLVASSHVRGLMVDRKQAEKLYELLDGVEMTALDELTTHGATPEILASPAQLAKLLFTDWGLPVLKLTPKGAPSTDKEVLYELFNTVADPRAQAVRNYREAVGNKSKFAVGTLNSLDYNGDGHTRPSMAIYSTYSGRCTFYSKQGKGKDERPTGIPIHQMKSDRGGKLDKEYRKMIVAPPGYTIVEFDAAGQEYRWLAVMSGDPQMLAMCAVGEDPHTFMGSVIANREYVALVAEVRAGVKGAKHQRQLGKVANLGLGYRAGAATLLSVARVQYGLPMVLEEAEKIHTAYRHAYPGVQKYWARQISICKKHGYAQTIAGRRVDLRGDWKKNKWSLESTAINFPIQGVGADQKYLALAILKPFLLRYGASFFFELHDGVYLLVPDDKVVEFAVEGKKLLDNLPYEKAWGWTPTIPLPWDCKIGKTWGNLKLFGPR